jgi:hypothetical protein
MKKRLTTWAALAVASVVFSGCYTVLQGPRMASTIDASLEDTYYSDQVYSDLTDGYPEVETVRPRQRNDPWANDGYGRGYPVTSSGYGGYGFGSPFAYGPSLGVSYPYGGHSSAYGPYGYGYDPYYSGRGGGSSYTPPGYQLVTSQDLAELRLENAALRAAASTTGGRPAATQQDAVRRRQAQAEQAWTQRSVPSTRKSTAAHRTPRPASTSSKPKVSSTSSKPASSSSKSSGGDAAKRRKKRR